MKNCLRLLLPMIVSISVQVSGQSLFFSNLTTRDGLPSNIISAVAQDGYDFIWIGTGNGLARYDGYTTRTFKREEHAASLPANEISALLVVGDTLWVGTWRGLCTIHTRNFTIRRVDLQGNNTVRTLYKDRHNNVWIGTATGLIRRQPTGRTTVYTHESHQLSHNTIRSIYVDEQDNLWVGTYDRLNWLNPKKVLFESFDLKQAYKPALKNNLIGDIKPVVGHDSLLWIGTETGLCRFNRRTHRYTTYRTADGLSNEVIKYIYTDPEGRVWLGTDFGLNLLNPGTGKTETYFHNPQVNYSIANNVIWQVMEDHGGVIWIVTANGLSKVNRHNNIFTYHEVTHQLHGQTSGNQVKALLTGRDGTLWIGTLHGVIAQHPDGSRQLFDTRAPLPYRLLLDNIFAFEEDNQGRIWIGTAGGINVWDARQQHMYAITAQPDNGLTSNYIARFIKGSDGSFWVSAWEGGLFKVVSGFETLQQVHFEYVGDFASEKITYARQALWGLRNNELFRIHLDSFVNQKIASFNEVARGRDIHNIYYAPQGNLWAGTANGLIEYQLDTDSAFFHPIVTGKPVDLTTLVSDEDGYIWAAADQLVLKFDPKQHRFERFPLDHELPLKTFYSDSRTLSASGDILLGGDNGYIQFNPHITPNTYAPQVRLTSLQVNNKPVTTTQPLPGQEDDRDHNDIAFVPELVLDYDQRSVTIGFSALHYWQPETNVYAYKLEGLDRDWQYVSGSKNFAVYSNLPAGDYTLVVRGTNNYGLWSPHTASLHLVVRPPLFLSKGFIALYILLVVGALVVAMRVYAVRLRLQNQLNIAVLEKEHAEKITQTKQQFFTSISHELRTPISLIIPPIQQALKRNHLDPEDRTLLSLAEKNSQRLLRLINQILDFRKLEHKNQSLTITWFDLVPFCQELYTLFADKAARQEIDFSFHSYVKNCTLWADQEKVEIILFNLISNAFKFTPRKGKIAVVLDIDTQLTPSGMALIRVSDTGVGIAIDEQRKVFEQFYQTQEARRHEDGSGIGLTLVAEYSRLHQGKVELSSTPGVGSTFSVYLPLGSDHWPVKPTDPADAVNMTVSNDSQPQISIKSDKPLVLLAEDNHDMIDFITVTLKDKYNFVVAEQGEEALDKARQYLPEVIVTDIMMPIMDGMALCRAVKQDPRTSHIPLILLTAKSLTTHKIEGIRSGADAYITKPFDIELLTAHIDHLRERKAELALYFRHELITAPQGDESKANNEDDKFLKKVMNTIEAHLADPDFGVEVLSEEVGMSATHLYRKLKSLTKLSANEIIRKYRLKKASFLLKNKEGNISEIMYAVGFSNLSYFSKCFKQEFGLNPKEYQQQENPEHL